MPCQKGQKEFTTHNYTWPGLTLTTCGKAEALLYFAVLGQIVPVEGYSLQAGALYVCNITLFVVCQGWHRREVVHFHKITTTVCLANVECSISGVLQKVIS